MNKIQVTKRENARARATVIPEGWLPNDNHAKHAASKGLDLDVEADKFRAHALAHDRRVVRWDQAFTGWLLNTRASVSRETSPPRTNGQAAIDLARSMQTPNDPGYGAEDQPW